MANLQEIMLEYDGEVSIRESSYLGVQPGDLILFSYEGVNRLGLVTKSKRAVRGLFLSSRNNLLMNIYLLDSITQSMFVLVVNNLYKNRIRCTYKNTPRILSAFLGKNNFRTFNVAKTSNIMFININK